MKYLKWDEKQVIRIWGGSKNLDGGNVEAALAEVCALQMLFHSSFVSHFAASTWLAP